MMRSASTKAAFNCVLLLTAMLLKSPASVPAQQLAEAPHSGYDANDFIATDTCDSVSVGSPYIPVDSWIYPAVLRLYSMGYLDSVYLGMRPWTRSDVTQMLREAVPIIDDASLYSEPTVGEAQDIYDALRHEFRSDTEENCVSHQASAHFETVYSTARVISGTPLRDSFHLGSTIVNDYGRPYQKGFNNYTGLSGYASSGRFSLYVRSEFQAKPSASGYSPALAERLSISDAISFRDPSGAIVHQATIPMGPISSSVNGSLIEAYASARYLNTVFSFGKQDVWWSPAQGGAMAYSNNADNIYSFRINRIRPFYISGLSRITGPFRYDFLIGPLKGHTFPNAPWLHVEKISFRPTRDLEFGFERTVIWGGEGHVPVTMGTFARSFFSFSAPESDVKHSRNDPGARFGAFDFSYRPPFIGNWITIYCDSEVHDDVSPIDAPRRAAWRPGIYLSHFPYVPKLDMRLEAASTDPPVSSSHDGMYMYYETVQRQGYTNSGQIFGDWIGREAKGGQAWITYHLSGNEWLQVSARNQKVAKDFISGGTTLNDLSFQAVKRMGRSLELNGNFSFERYRIPIYEPGQHTVTSSSVQLTWRPNRSVSF